MGSCIEFFASNQKNSRSRYYTLTSTNSQAKDQRSQCLLWAQRWLPNNWLPHNLSLDEKKDVFREPIKLSLFN